MNTIFNSIHDDFTANIFADYFEEHDQFKTARLLLTPPQGKDTTLEKDCIEDGGYGCGGGYDDGIAIGEGYGCGGYAEYADSLQVYQETFHFLQSKT
jgi:hypothetical protein